MATRLDLEARRRLDAILPEPYYQYCVQCGACVSDCPGHLYVEAFNPREIVFKVLTGQLDELIRKDSVIWKCTNCYTCFERCPQDVRPIEIIIALKNLAVASGEAPKEMDDMLRTVRRTGRALPISGLVERRRKELGLGDVPKPPLEEIRRLEEERG
jgi:heterodisulfide reductase subunit C